MKEEEKKEEKKLRQIILETDWNILKIVKLEVAWTLEFKAILNSLMDYCNNPQK